MIKLIGTAYRREDFSPEEFMRYWTEVHAPIGGSVPGIRGYVVSEVVQKLQGDLDADAFVEVWYDDMEAFERAGASPEQAAAWADVGNYAKSNIDVRLYDVKAPGGKLAVWFNFARAAGGKAQTGTVIPTASGYAFGFGVMPAYGT